VTSTEKTNGRELNHGALGTPSVIFLALATVAPIAVVAAPMALGFAIGNGVGVPGTFVLAGLTLLCFAAGYAAMSRHVTNAGAFYSYIARGLGRPAGLGASFVALVSYNAIFCSVVGALGYYGHLTFKEHLGIDLPWWAWAFIGLAVVALLGRRQVDLNAMILGVALIVEVGIITLLDVKILIDRGFGALNWHSFNPSAVIHGSGLLGLGGVGVSVVFAFGSFIGFEATAIFGEETRDPRRTVPRATYITVIIVTVFYAFTSLMLISAYNTHDMQAALIGPDPKAPNPGLFLFVTNQQFVGTFTTKLMEWLVITSIFACMLGVHNACSRYFFALGREGALPRALGRTHPKLQAPHIASGTQVAIAAVVTLAFALAHEDPLLVFTTSMTGLGTLGIVALQGLTSIAVIGFFWKRGDGNLLTTRILPLVGAAGLGTACALILHNYTTFAGTPNWALNHDYWLLVFAMVIGVGYAVWLRANRRDVYSGLGGTPVWEQKTLDTGEQQVPLLAGESL
jgi:amino acid transporter